MKQMVVGRRHALAGANLDVRPAFFTGGMEKAPMATRRINGKTHFFGRWGALTEGVYYEKWQAVVDAADESVALKKDLKAAGFLTDEGVNVEMQKVAGEFLRDKKKTTKRLADEREEIQTNVTKLYQLDDWDINSPFHNRLINRFTTMASDERSALIRNTEEPDVIRALITEPQFVTGIDEDAKAKLRDKLLDDEQRESLAQFEAELSMLATIDRAYETASDVILEQAMTTENALMDALIIGDDEDEPPEEKSLADGGVFKFGDDNAETDTD